MQHMTTMNALWWAFGWSAQAIFAMRFVWQWIASERRKEMVVPLGFWYLSIVGGVMLTIYTVFRTGDPVLVTGQAAGLVIYVRNLMLIRRSERAKREAARSLRLPDSMPVRDKNAA
jgi:lipid-A-disaccharide synthase-like uncharacterized protein